MAKKNNTKQVSPQVAKMDSTAKAINYKITKAAMSGNRPEARRLKTEMVNLDKRANSLPSNQPTRFKKSYKK